MGFRLTHTQTNTPKPNFIRVLKTRAAQRFFCLNCDFCDFFDGHDYVMLTAKMTLFLRSHFAEVPARFRRWLATNVSPLRGKVSILVYVVVNVMLANPRFICVICVLKKGRAADQKRAQRAVNILLAKVTTNN
jgi:hypothetical protein